MATHQGYAVINNLSLCHSVILVVGDKNMLAVHYHLASVYSLLLYPLAVKITLRAAAKQCSIKRVWRLRTVYTAVNYSQSETARSEFTSLH